MYKVCQGIKCTNTCILYIKEFINLIHNSYINHAKMYDSDCSPLTKKILSHSTWMGTTSSHLPIYILISSFLWKINSKSWICVILPLNQWSCKTYRFVLQGGFPVRQTVLLCSQWPHLFRLCGSQLYHSKIFLMLKYLNKNLP